MDWMGFELSSCVLTGHSTVALVNASGDCY